MDKHKIFEAADALSIMRALGVFIDGERVKKMVEYVKFLNIRAKVSESFKLRGGQM